MITSTSNSQVKAIHNLIKKSGERNSRGLFVIEGIRMFVETPKDRIEKVYVSENFYKSNQIQLEEYQYEIVSDSVFSQMSDTKTPQGIMALVKMLEYHLEDIYADKRVPLILVLENIQDPGNLGTIIRTAEGAGVTGIILSKKTVDIYNPKTIRSTMGALYRMPFCYQENLIDCIGDFHKRGIKTMAADLKGDHIYYQEELTIPLAIYIGNEGNGLTEELSNTADIKVKIPMEGMLESLNAAISTAILLYECKRQKDQI